MDLPKGLDRTIISGSDRVLGRGPKPYMDKHVELQDPTDAEPENGRQEETAGPQPTLPSEPALSNLGRGRGWRLAHSPATLILPLALLALILYFLGPGLLSRNRSAGEQLPRPESRSLASELTATPMPAAGAVLEDEDIAQSLRGQLRDAARLVQEGRLEHALGLYETAAKQAPKDPQPEIGWAKALLLLGRAAEALPHARRAVELEPLNAEAMTALAQAYLGVGDFARGLGIGQAAVELDSNSAEAHAVLAEAYLADGKYRVAVEEAEQGVAIDPASAEAHRALGLVYMGAGQGIERAIEEMRLAADSAPGVWRYRLDLSRLLLQVGAYEEALASLQQALSLAGQHRDIDEALAEAHYWLGDEEKAAAYLEQARDAGADGAGVYALTAAIRARQGLCMEAQTAYERALGSDPANSLALEAKAACEGVPATPAPLPESTVPEPTASPAVSSTSPPDLEGSIAFPVWNTDAQRYDVYVSQTDGTGRKLLLSGAHQPAFSPSGEWLAVNGERHLQENLLVLRLDEIQPWEVTEHAEDGLPDWSPDGKGLAFSSTQHGDRQSRLYVLDAVPLDGHRASARVLKGSLDDVRGVHPTWTDEGLIVYNGCDYSVEPSVCGLLRIPLGTGLQTPTPLTRNASDTAPAAQGGWIAFMSQREGSWDIYVVDEDGSGLQRLTRGSANEGLPAWSPDGRSLAYVSDEGGRWAVWAMASDGSNQRMLFPIGGGGLAKDWTLEQISWAP